MGVTGVYAAEFTRQGIFDALRERRTFGTTGDRIIVDFRLDERPMGSSLTPSAPSLTGYLSVIGTDAIASIRLVRNGQTCREWAPGGLQFTHTWQQEHEATPHKPGARAYYYVVIAQRNAEMAWTSPIFVYQR